MNPPSPISHAFLFLIILLIFIILALFKNGLKGLEMIWEIFCRKRQKEPGEEVCCLEVPPDLRPRPDPSIYSQKWLMARGLGVTWNNPDFQLIDVATNMVVDSSSLSPSTDYKVVVTVHNLSTMAAIGTKVSFQIKSFGLDGGTFATPDEVMVDIPAVGSNTCFTIWHTPLNVGHICLVAILQHPDDANPMNNEGQHNTVIVGAEDAQKSVEFVIHNGSKAERQYDISFDTYQLPASPMHAKGLRERNSIGYLRKLQEVNKRIPLNLEQIGFSIVSSDGQNLGKRVSIAAGSTTKFILKPNDAANVQGKRLNVVATNPNTGKVISGLTVIYK